jgi:transcriptional regulator with XRE-family HTH domain
MKNLGETLRNLREDKNLPLRTVAAFLDIDQAILSKIERGQRKASRDQIVKLAEYFRTDENGLLIAWLSDKLVFEVQDEVIAVKALQVAEKKINYLIKSKNGK